MTGKRLTGITVCSGIMLYLTAWVVAAASFAATPGEGGDHVWGAEYFPNVELTSQDGRSLRFFDDVVKDKVVMINMIFTRCPDICPLETARLLEVQKILGDRVGKDVFMYSITIDPEHDTPEVLKAYTEKYQVGPGWTFLTGSKDDITLIRRKLGMYDEEVDNDILANHGVTMIMGNQRTGQWMKVSPFENPYILATKVGNWLHNWKLPPRPGQSYAEAPKVRTISMGETLFRTRCSSCHTIGAAKDSLAAKRAIGPDLAGVTTSRDRVWLTRWISEPDKMLEEKDPLAIALFDAYNQVVMPNFHLTPTEVAALISYLEEETAIRGQDQAGDRPAGGAVAPSAAGGPKSNRLHPDS